VLHHPEYRQRYAANLKRELPRIPFVKADPSTPPEAGSARDDKEENGSTGRAGLQPGSPARADFARDGVGQAGVNAASIAPSSLPKASAQPLAAERHKKTAGPSTRAEALARDDKREGDGGRGAEAPLYPNGLAERNAQPDESSTGSAGLQPGSPARADFARDGVG